MGAVLRRRLIQLAAPARLRAMPPRRPGNCRRSLRLPTAPLKPRAATPCRPPTPAEAGRPSGAEGNGTAETAEPPLVRAGKTGGVAQEKSNAPTPPAKSQATEPKAAGRPTKAKRRDSLTVAGPLAKKPDSSQRRPLFLGATNSTDFPRDQPAQPDGAAPEEVGAGREVSYQTGASPKTGALPTARRPTLATVGSLGHFCLTPRGSATQGRSKRGCV